MLTPEGADDAEIIVRPGAHGGWQVEVPTVGGLCITVVKSEQEALACARALRPRADVRILPAAESADSLHSDLRRD